MFCNVENIENTFKTSAKIYSKDIYIYQYGVKYKNIKPVDNTSKNKNITDGQLNLLNYGKDWKMYHLSFKNLVNVADLKFGMY